VFAESSESRAAVTTMMMTTERGGPAPPFASCATAWRARRRPSVPSARAHPSNQEWQPHQQRAAENDKSNHRPIVEIVAGQLAARLALGTCSMRGHWVRTAWFQSHCR
jgi:hypothetical protein